MINPEHTIYAGIDYSPLGSTINRDVATNIRYGVISQNSLNPEAYQDIWDNGTDLTFEGYKEEAKLKIRQALSDYFSDYKHGEQPSKLDAVVSDAWDAIEQDICDNYESDSPEMFYEKDGYKIKTCLQSDLFVMLSPFFTYAQYCSPCVPGACNLDVPLQDSSDSAIWPDSNKCYCLGADWFDDNKPPYPIYSVATGKRVEL